MHFLCEPVDLPSCIDKDHGLCDCQGLVEVAECVQLPLLVGGQREDSITTRVQRRSVKYIQTPNH